MRTSEKNIESRCIYIKYVKSYQEDIVRQKYEVIPGTFDAVFKAVLTEEKEVLAEIIELVIGIPKEEVIKNGVI